MLKKSYGKFILLFVMAVSSIHNSVTAQEALRPSKLLLSAFANQCPHVVTRNVSATLNTLHILGNTLEELKKDANCGGVLAFSSSVSRYASLYEDFEAQNLNSENKIALEKKIALYSSMLIDPNLEPAQASFIRSEIIKSQALLVEINSPVSRFKNFSGKEARVADQLVRSADDFLTELQSIQGNACYQKNAAKISSIMSNALLVTSAFSTGGTSLSLAASAVITKALGQYVGMMSYDSSLKQIQDIEMPTALRCVSQALTDQFCVSSETQELIEERIESNNTSSAHLDGINLLSYQLNPLSRWLDEVFSGSAITSEGDLINREKSEIQAEFLRKTAAYLDTFGTIKRKFFLTLDSETNLKTAIAQNIDCLVGLLSSPSLNPCYSEPSASSVENPIFTSYSRSLMSYTLYEPGVHQTVPYCGNERCSSFSNYVNFFNKNLTIADWDRVIRNANDIIQSTQNLVNIERSKMISVDAYSIIVNAKREYKGETSPLKGLMKIVANAERISSYLQKMGCQEVGQASDCEGLKNKYSPEIINIKKTKDLTIQIINLVNEGMIPRSLPTEVLPAECAKDRAMNEFTSEEDVLEIKSFQITSCISKILKLQERGTDVYFSKIRNMVSYEMEARLLNGDLGDGVVNVINATRADLLQSILNSYSIRDHAISLGELNISLESAQNNSKESLITFFDHFKDSVVDSLKSEKVTKIEKYDLCFRILPYLQSRKANFLKEIYPVCQGAVFSVYKNGPVMRFTDYVKFTPRSGLSAGKYELLQNQNLRKFFCGYRDYNRSNLLIDEQNKQKRRQQRSR